VFQVIDVTGTAYAVAVVRKPYAVVTCTSHIACPWEVHVTLMSLPIYKASSYNHIAPPYTHAREDLRCYM